MTLDNTFNILERKYCALLLLEVHGKMNNLVKIVWTKQKEYQKR